MSDSTISFAVLVAVVVLFVWNRLPVEIVAIAAALALFLTGVLDLQQTLAGFGDPAVIFIAALFVVSEGLDASGVTAWVGQRLVALAGTGRERLLILTMLTVAVLTALISVNGAVAALLPVVVVIAVRVGRPTSQLLMPLVFAAHAGSMLTLTGTPVNVIINEAAANAGGHAFGYFEFALVGIPLLAGTIAVIVLFGERLLPRRSGRSIPADLSRHARTLLEQYDLHDGVFRLRVRASSPWVGLRPEAVDLSAYPTLALVGLQAAAGSPVADQTLAEGDIAIVRGDAAGTGDLAREQVLGLRSETASADVADALFNLRSGLAEIVVPPRSKLIGEPVFPGMVTSSGDLMVLAVQRGGVDRGPGTTDLVAGDTLLLQGTWDALDDRLDDPNVLVVDAPEVVRRQALGLGLTARAAIGVLVAMVVLLVTGAVPAAIAGLLAASGMVVLRVVSVEKAYRSINWTTVVLVGAMISLSTAMTVTGAAEQVAEALVGVVANLGPYALLVGLFAITAVLGQLISNMATALIVIPIAVAAAKELGISIEPVLMSVTVAAAAAFLTPVATPVNLMVMGPGGYQFGDYWKLGLPLLILFFLVSVFLVPVFWSF